MAATLKRYVVPAVSPVTFRVTAVEPVVTVTVV
jgi:hypothetical protein